MKIVTTPEEIQSIALAKRMQGQTIGLVPTMGYFHEGHLALMREAKRRADCVITTLFINPMQFGPTEDLDNYPHDFGRDTALAESVGVDFLYAPSDAAMYNDAFSSTVHVEGLTSGLCGAARPGHFDGVTTVVAKLFNQTLPDIAVFGQKDFQQLAVIRRMTSDLDFPIEIIAHPIVREESGLAMSSRNTYLKKEEMGAALSLSQAIAGAKELAADPSSTSNIIKNNARELIEEHAECTIDYVEIVNALSLEPCDTIDADSIILLAVKINKRIRLIDNSPLLDT